MKHAPLAAEAFVYWTVMQDVRGARVAGEVPADTARDVVNELEVLGNYTLSPVLARLCARNIAAFQATRATGVA